MSGITTFGQLEVHSIQHVFVAVASDICAQQKRRDGKQILKGGKEFHWVVSWKDPLLVIYKWMYRTWMGHKWHMSMFVDSLRACVF